MPVNTIQQSYWPPDLRWPLPEGLPLWKVRFRGFTRIPGAPPPLSTFAIRPAWALAARATRLRAPCCLWLPVNAVKTQWKDDIKFAILDVLVNLLTSCRSCLNTPANTNWEHCRLMRLLYSSKGTYNYEYIGLFYYGHYGLKCIFSILLV